MNIYPATVIILIFNSNQDKSQTITRTHFFKFNMALKIYNLAWQ